MDDTPISPSVNPTQENPASADSSHGPSGFYGYNQTSAPVEVPGAANTNVPVSPSGHLTLQETMKCLRDNLLQIGSVLAGIILPNLADFINAIFSTAQATNYGQYTPELSLAFLLIAPWVNRLVNFLRVR